MTKYPQNCGKTEGELRHVHGLFIAVLAPQRVVALRGEGKCAADGEVLHTTSGNLGL